MAYENQKAASQERRALKSQGLQNTQRYWDNYVGDNPVSRYLYTDYYNKSPRWGATASAQQSIRPQQKPATQPEENKTTQNDRNPYGYIEKDYTKEGWVRDRYGYWVRPKGYKPNSPSQDLSPVPAMPSTNDNSWRFSLIGGAPTLSFPQSLSIY